MKREGDIIVEIWGKHCTMNNICRFASNIAPELFNWLRYDVLGLNPRSVHQECNCIV